MLVHKKAAFQPSAHLVGIDGFNQFFKPQGPKNNHIQANAAGDWNWADADDHENEQYDEAFDSGQTGGVHGVLLLCLGTIKV